MSEITKTSIFDCITQNASFLGPEYCQLGAAIKSGWFSRKVFLAYDAQKGWSVVVLNIFQLFLRKVLGAYKNTHLTKVYRAWKDQRTEGDEALTRRMKLIKYGHCRSFSILGNSSLREATVICLPEVHHDSNHTYAVCQFIQDHYRVGDSILVEGQRVGKSSRDLLAPHLQVPILNPKIPFSGWEPEEEFLPEAENDEDQLFYKMMTRLTGTCKMAHHGISAQNLDSFITSARELVPLFYPPGKITADETENWIRYQYSLHTTDTIGPRIFQNKMKRLVWKMIKRETVAYHKFVSSSELLNAKLDAGMKRRNHSLCQEIQKLREEHRRVFVIAGARHFMRVRRDDTDTSEVEVHSLLRQHKFTVLVDECEFYPNRLRAINPSLFGN